MRTSRSQKLRILTLTGLFTALTTVATLVIQIPTLTKGYINLGDTIVNLAAWLLGPVYGTAAAGIGSALADLIAGYTIYAPATLVIKALMAAASFGVFTAFSKKWHTLPARIAGAVTAEVIMIAGYAIFEAFLYGSLGSALLSVSGNLVQGIFGAGASVALYELLIRHVPKFLRSK